MRYSETDNTFYYTIVPLLRVETWGQGNAEYLWSYALKVLLRGIHYRGPSKTIVWPGW